MPVISRLPSGGGMSELYDFPLTISTTQPTAEKAGHIWVNSSNDSSITTVKILEAVNAGESNGTLMLVVGDLALRNISVSHTKGSKTFSIADNSNASADWTVSSITDGITSTIKFNRPLVYSKISGVIDIEDAYMYTGSAWVMISQKGHYAMMFSNTSPYSNPVYTMTNDTFISNTTLISNETADYFSSASSDFTYIVVGKNVYKRIGDIFSLYYTIGNYTYYGFLSVPFGACITPNGNRLIVTYAYYASNYYYYGYVTFIDNGSTFVAEYVTPYSGSGTSYAYNVKPNSNANGTIILGYNNGMFAVAVYFNGSGYSLSTTIPTFYSGYGYSSVHFSKSGTYAFVTRYVGSNAYCVYRYTLSLSANTYQAETFISSSSGFIMNRVLGIHPFGYEFVLTGGSIGGSNYYLTNVYNESGTKYTIICDGVQDGMQVHYYSKISFNLTGNRMLVTNSNLNTVYYYSISLSGTTFTAVLLNSFSMTGVLDAILAPY